MNDIMGRLIEINLYINLYLMNLYINMLNFQTLIFTNIIIGFFLYYITYEIFENLKSLSFFKYEILSDFTITHFLGQPREFSLFYYLISYIINYKNFIKKDMKKEDLNLSICEIYINSNWLEREIWDMYGLKLFGHLDLRRILTDYGFIGFPLLKNFPLIGYLELRYDDLKNMIIKEKIEFSQHFRIFSYDSTWNNKDIIYA